jgi:protein involved in polysaccharide export with SLBB domain
MKRCNLLGKVNRPGQYEYRGRLTFLELLSRAGGLAQDAGSQAYIKRKSESEHIKSGDLVIDLKALVQEGNIFRDIEILDEDTVTVTEAGTYFLAGEVRRAGQYRFEEGMTFIRAFTIAGGLTEHAATDKIKVVRFEGDREQLVEVGMDSASLEGLVHRNDLIVVSMMRTQVCYVTGEVKTAGSVPCDQTTTVFKAVTLAGGFTDAAATNKIRIMRRVDGQSKKLEKVRLEEPVLPDDIIVIPRSFF